MTEQGRQVDFLQAQQYAMQALGLLALDLLGTTTCASGLSCGPTSPASMNVTIQPGRIYQLENLEQSAWGQYMAAGGLPADTNANHDILKQGILMDPATLTATAPVTVGYSQNFLVEATYQDSDTNSTTVNLYNVSNPTVPLTATINTERAGLCSLTLKAGTPATTGSQTTPAPDSGYIGLWVITVAYGQTTITSGNITPYLPSSFIPATLNKLGVGGPLQFVTFANQQSSGTGGGAVSGSSWNLVPNNTVLNDPGGLNAGGVITLNPSNGQITVAQAGTYRIKIAGPCDANGHRIRLYLVSGTLSIPGVGSGWTTPVTGPAAVISGSSENSYAYQASNGVFPGSNPVWTTSTLDITVVAGAAFTFRVDHWVGSAYTGSGTNALGHPSSDGTPETYATCMVARVG